jgi:hypothetical protein
MKIIRIICALLAVLLPTLTGCSTARSSADRSVGRETAGKQTVLITYHVQPGKEAEFGAVLNRGWQVYRTERMVCAEPHIIVREVEDGNKPCFIEIFTWVKSPDQAPASVKAIWNQEQSLCEARGGHRGIEGGEVTLILGR